MSESHRRALIEESRAQACQSSSADRKRRNKRQCQWIPLQRRGRACVRLRQCEGEERKQWGKEGRVVFYFEFFERKTNSKTHRCKLPKKNSATPMKYHTFAYCKHSPSTCIIYQHHGAKAIKHGGRTKNLVRN